MLLNNYGLQFKILIKKLKYINFYYDFTDLSSQHRTPLEGQDNSPPTNRILHRHNLNNPNQNNNFHNPNQVPPGTHIVIQNGFLRPVHGNTFIQPIYDNNNRIVALNESGRIRRLSRNNGGRQISNPINHPPSSSPFPRRPQGNN